MVSSLVPSLFSIYPGLTGLTGHNIWHSSSPGVLFSTRCIVCVCVCVPLVYVCVFMCVYVCMCVCVGVCVFHDANVCAVIRRHGS